MGSKINIVGTGSISAFDWQESVLDIINDPPGAPADGDRYIVDTVPTGAWVGHASDIAQWNGSAWSYITPNKGYSTYVESLGEIYVWDGSWAEIPTTPLATTTPADSTFAAAAVGTATSAARADHKHDLGAPAAPVNSTFAAASAGASAVPARADHKHDLGTPGAPPSVSGNVGSAGTSTTPARSDHTHQVLASASANNVGASSSGGGSTQFSRGDHIHGHGDQAGGTLHADVVAGVQTVS